MLSWSIYYADGNVVSGETAEEWRSAPDHGVQVVVLWEIPHWSNRPWANVNDRKLWTGEDEYDPFGLGVKRGSLIPWDDYWSIWERAAYGDR